MFWVIILFCIIVCIFTYGLFWPTDYEDEDDWDEVCKIANSIPTEEQIKKAKELCKKFEGENKNETGQTN